MGERIVRWGAPAQGTCRAAGVGLIVVALGFAACSGAASPSPSVPPSSEPSLVPTVEPSPAVEPTAAGLGALAKLETLAKEDVIFEEEQQLNALGKLDILWPVEPGPWPVAVMFAGGTGNKAFLSTNAWYLARTGYVVFVPSWGSSGGPVYDALAPHEQADADAAQAACAVAFAAQEAPKYGGDPSWLTVFGHSAGANIASVVAFKTPEPSAGCLADRRADGDVLVAWEGDWFIAEPIMNWDPLYAADPALFDSLTPWAHIASRPGLKVVVLESEDPGLGRDATDALGPDGWLTVRDPTGAFTAAFEAMGAFDDNYIAMREMQTVLTDRLRETGNLLSYNLMPGSTHDRLAAAGWVVFLDAFKRTAALAD